MTTALIRFTQRARAQPRTRFNALMGLLFDPKGLHASFERQDGRKAPGVDGIRKADYGQGLEERIMDLSSRLRRLGYRPQSARRVYIPKSGSGWRPLGVPCFEDKLVQDRLSQILRFRRKLQELNERLRALRVRGGTAMLRYFRQHMQGHIQYYGVSGNYRQLATYAYVASRLLYKWLNRRSQRRSTTWARFRPLLHGRWLPRLRIYHNLYPKPLWKPQAGSRMV